MLDWYAFKDIEPRLSAAGLICRKGETGREVLLGRRNDALEFMAGHYVFPGGSIDDSDTAEYVDNSACEDIGLAIFAAAREIFEETGLLCTGNTLNISHDELRSYRLELLRQKIKFTEILDKFRLKINAEAFTPAGEWVTPAFSPKRYLTYYFLYELEGEHKEEVIEEDGELVSLEWHTPEDARKRWNSGNLRISTPIAYMLRHLAAFSETESLLHWIVKTPGHDHNIPNRFELKKGIHLIPLRTPTLPPATHTNCVVIGEDEVFIIDPGADDENEQEHLFNHLEHLEALGEKISGVILTHGHIDHIAGVENLLQRWRVPVYAHSYCAQQVPFQVKHHLEDGDIVEIPGNPGWKLQTMHTPGHDPGHLCFYEIETQTMIFGDMLANPGTIVVSPDYDGDMDDYMNSLERLLEPEYSFSIPAHGMPFWGGSGKDKVRELITHRLEREEKINSAFNEGARSMKELLEKAYDDTSKETWPLAEHQLRAHLIRLGLDITK